MRAEKGIKVRQPLFSLTIKNKNIFLGYEQELFEILKDEVNVKEIICDTKQNDEVVLNTTITHELKEEGMLREILRMIQDLRQDAKLTPKDKIVLFVQGEKEMLFIFEKHKALIQKEVSANDIYHKKTELFLAEIESTLEGEKILIKIQKA